MTPNPDHEDDLNAACAVLSRAARQRLLAMPPRQRVLALMRQGHEEFSGELLMFAYDLHAVLASFEGDEVPSLPGLQDLRRHVGPLLDRDREPEFDAWLFDRPDLDAELMQLAARLFAAANRLEFPSEATVARFVADADEVRAYRDEASLRIAAAKPNARPLTLDPAAASHTPTGM